MIFYGKSEMQLLPRLAFERSFEILICAFKIIRRYLKPYSALSTRKGFNAQSYFSVTVILCKNKGALKITQRNIS